MKVTVAMVVYWVAVSHASWWRWFVKPPLNPWQPFVTIVAEPSNTTKPAPFYYRDPQTHFSIFIYILRDHHIWSHTFQMSKLEGPQQTKFIPHSIRVPNLSTLVIMATNPAILHTILHTMIHTMIHTMSKLCLLFLNPSRTLTYQGSVAGHPPNRFRVSMITIHAEWLTAPRPPDCEAFSIQPSFPHCLIYHWPRRHQRFFHSS